ncbi:hypothetical protein L1887_42130 [Cichorium endivia]|nr:hypothetical protein L1887_42130 [Cichorium endivia]
MGLANQRRCIAYCDSRATQSSGSARYLAAREKKVTPSLSKPRAAGPKQRSAAEAAKAKPPPPRSNQIHTSNSVNRFPSHPPQTSCQVTLTVSSGTHFGFTSFHSVQNTAALHPPDHPTHPLHVHADYSSTSFTDI